MTIHPRFAVRAAAFGSLMTFSAASFAHVDLTTPNPRAHGQTQGNLKSGPCGQTANGRTGNVNVFAPGQTITVTWNEYIDHPAYYRIAFDDDGDDGFAMRTDGQTNQAADNPQAAEAALNMDAEILAIVTEQNDTTAGQSTDIRSVDVTLPDVTCENCTLQLIQYMYNNPGQGYYQCADIALRAAQTVSETPDSGIGEGGSANTGEAGAAGAGDTAGAGGAGGAGGAPSASNGGSTTVGTGSAPPPASGSVGGASSTGTGGRASTAGSGGTASTAGTGATPVVATDDNEDDGGCTISTHTSEGRGSFGLFSLIALGLGLVARRRR